MKTKTDFKVDVRHMDPLAFYKLLNSIPEDTFVLTEEEKEQQKFMGLVSINDNQLQTNVKMVIGSKEFQLKEFNFNMKHEVVPISLHGVNLRFAGRPTSQEIRTRIWSDQDTYQYFLTWMASATSSFRSPRAQPVGAYKKDMLVVVRHKDKTRTLLEVKGVFPRHTQYDPSDVCVGVEFCYDYTLGNAGPNYWAP